jgi:hypothetical protein
MVLFTKHGGMAPGWLVVTATSAILAGLTAIIASTYTWHVLLLSYAAQAFAVGGWKSLSASRT